METRAELEKKANGLAEKERVLTGEVAERASAHEALIRGLGFIPDELSRMLKAARRLVELKAQRKAAMPAELPPSEAIELHDLNLTVPEQLLRVVHLDAALPAKRQELADVTHVLAETRAALEQWKPKPFSIDESAKRRPDLAKAYERCHTAAAAVDTSANQQAAALREFFRAEAELAHLLNTPRALRALSFRIARDHRVHAALARVFELNPKAPSDVRDFRIDYATGQFGVNAMLHLPGCDKGGPSRDSLAKQSDELYRELIAEVAR